MPETVARLNELLEAERAGVETLQALIKTVPKGYFRNHLVKIEADEAYFCAVLERAVRAAGGQPSRATGDFAAKVLALDTLVDRPSSHCRMPQYRVGCTRLSLDEPPITSQLAKDLTCCSNRQSPGHSLVQVSGRGRRARSAGGCSRGRRRSRRRRR
jgi:hypothetical protein